jgi:autotransporter-associated beta strand protein
LNSGSPLLINRTGNLTVWDNISGAADIDITGGATVTFNGVNNTYSGATWVTNGMLFVNGTNVTVSTYVYGGGLGGAGTFTGPITLDPGTTFSPGAANSVGTFTAQSDLTLNATNLVIDVNKLLSPSNDIVSVSGALNRTATGGLLTVHNRGPQDLVPGDKFTLFGQPLPNGASFTITGGRATWVNNLAVDGSISVATVINVQPPLSFTHTGTNTLVFSWSDPYNSFKLQAKTNNLITGAWADYPGGGSSPITVPISRTNNAVFYRIVSVP